MHKDLEDAVLAATGADNIVAVTAIQTLWSGYGEILRSVLNGGEQPSVILKHIKLPASAVHPRGWSTDLSHKRKAKSYQVEAHWYEHYARRCVDECPVPRCLAVSVIDSETLLVLTDLDAAGYTLRKDRATAEDIKACIRWLASFHALFMNASSDGLWESGGYWHLDTRPDELAALQDQPLRAAAPQIDKQLRECRYQTLVHGDAKLANFCFTPPNPTIRVAAVDFQYVGRGCGMKDLAYFIGSCLSEDECEAQEERLLEFYFSNLRDQLSLRHPSISANEVENEWRAMYDVAWADFHRFLKGWSPGHWKINSYSERLTLRVIERLQR